MNLRFNPFSDIIFIIIIIIYSATAKFFAEVLLDHLVTENVRLLLDNWRRSDRIRGRSTFDHKGNVLTWIEVYSGILAAELLYL